MRGQLSLVTRLFFIVGMLIMLVVFTSEISFYNAQVKEEVSRYDLVYAAQDLAAALISENCLSAGNNSLSKEKLDLFAENFNSSENPCAHMYGYGYTAEVSTFPNQVRIVIIVEGPADGGNFSEIKGAEIFNGTYPLREDTYPLVVFSENSVQDNVSWIQSKRIFFPQENESAMAGIYQMDGINETAKQSANSSGETFASVYSYSEESGCETLEANDANESVIVECGDDLFAGISAGNADFADVAENLIDLQAGIAPETSWEFGASGISRTPQVSFSIPVTVDYDGKGAFGKISITVASGDLEMVSGAIDYSCASGNDSSLNIAVKNRLYASGSQLCVDYGDGISCRRIDCGKQLEMPDILPGTHSLTVNVGQEKISVTP